MRGNAAEKLDLECRLRLIKGGLYYEAQDQDVIAFKDGDDDPPYSARSAGIAWIVGLIASSIALTAGYCYLKLNEFDSKIDSYHRICSNDPDCTVYTVLGPMTCEEVEIERLKLSD